MPRGLGQRWSEGSTNFPKSRWLHAHMHVLGFTIYTMDRSVDENLEDPVNLEIKTAFFQNLFFAKDWSDGFNRRGCSTSDSLVIPAQCMRISTLKYLKRSKKLQLQSWKNEIARCSNLWDFAMRLRWNDWQTTKLTMWNDTGTGPHCVTVWINCSTSDFAIFP